MRSCFRCVYAPSLLISSLLGAQPGLDLLPGEALVDALFALAHCLESPTAPWLARVTACLTSQALDLSPKAAARLLWALAQLKHHPGPSLITACCSAMATLEPHTPAVDDKALLQEVVSDESNLISQMEATSMGISSQSGSPVNTLAHGLALPVTVDAIWGLSSLGAPVPPEWIPELFTRLGGK